MLTFWLIKIIFISLAKQNEKHGCADITFDLKTS